MSNKIILAILLMMFVGMGIGFILGFTSSSDRFALRVTSFEECVEAGYPIVPARRSSGVGGESHPEQCITPDGRVFAKMIDDEDEVFCTMDAKLCPDGSHVGRVPPDCEFAACPGKNQNR